MSKIGKVLKIQHGVTLGKGGLAKLTPLRKPVYVVIGTEYIGDRVRAVGSLDVWQVRPSSDSRAQFETYAGDQ